MDWIKIWKIIQYLIFVLNLLLSNHELLVEPNREYVETIDMVIHLAFQELAYRGHNESKTTLSQGINLDFQNLKQIS